MSEAGNRILEGLKEAVAIARGEVPAASITIKGHTYVPKSTSWAWNDVEVAPRRGHVILRLNDSIPDVPMVAVGSFISEPDAAELGETVSAAGGWMIWTSGEDWYVIPFDDAHGWMTIPADRD